MVNITARRDVRDYIQKNLSDPINVALAELALAVMKEEWDDALRAALRDNLCSRLRYAADQNIVREVFQIISR